MLSCTSFINRTITEEVPCFWEGNPQDWKGIQIFFVLCPGVFFYDEHTPCKSLCSNLAFFGAHLPYLGDYVHFLGINAHNSSSNNRYMKGCTRTAWKTMLVPFSKFSSLLQGVGRDFNGCMAIVNHKRVIYWVINYRKMKCMLEKHDAWQGAMVWPHRAW